MPRKGAEPPDGSNSFHSYQMATQKHLCRDTKWQHSNIFVESPNGSNVFAEFQTAAKSLQSFQTAADICAELPHGSNIFDQLSYTDGGKDCVYCC